jgi:ATP-dependent Lon protease
MEQREKLSTPPQGIRVPILPLPFVYFYKGQVVPIDFVSHKARVLYEQELKAKLHEETILLAIFPVLKKDSDRFEEIGFLGQVKSVTPHQDHVTVTLEMVERIKLAELVHTDPYPYGIVLPYPYIELSDSARYQTVISQIKGLIYQLLDYLPPFVAGPLSDFIRKETRLDALAFHITNLLNLDSVDAYAIFCAESIEDVAIQLQKLLIRRLEIEKVRGEIAQKVQEELDQQQRDFILRQQLKAIQKELGEDDEVTRLKKLAEGKQWPSHVQEVFERELRHLSHTHPSSPEYAVTLHYLDWLLKLPWGIYSDTPFSIQEAQRLLEKEHYGLRDVKERILEYLALLKFKPDVKAPILCFVGPPGVGKTSLARSIASALKRQFVRVSLGGVRDEAEIRGHRKTYIGAMPGKIIQGIRKAKTSNPVFLLDELDKIGQDFRGDPASALLEVLDPEQNHSFLDHFLGVEYDLSKVLFIGTANTLDTLHPALLDRLEVIQLSGYTLQEKVQIARHYLIPRINQAYGLKSSQWSIPKKVLIQVIEQYTREAGVRLLQQKLESMARKAIRNLLENNQDRVRFTSGQLKTFLGPPKYWKEADIQITVPGVALGLAWTPYGGDILFIEVVLSKGKGQITLTGRLGEVMKESANIAYAYLRSCAEQFQIPADLFEETNVYLHVPEGAIPKDGPSAGIAILVALISAFVRHKVDPYVAMTGELTLRGKILKVGGIKEKLLAAHRYGVKKVLIPQENVNDLETLPLEELKDLEIVPVERVEEVIEHVFPRNWEGLEQPQASYFP